MFDAVCLHFGRDEYSSVLTAWVSFSVLVSHVVWVDHCQPLVQVLFSSQELDLFVSSQVAQDSSGRPMQQG